MVRAPTRSRILSLLTENGPMSHREIVEETGFSDTKVQSGLWRCWRDGYVLRTKEPQKEMGRSFHGRLGMKENMRSYHLYAIPPNEEDEVVIRGRRFVVYDSKYMDGRSKGKKSKAQMILDFLEEKREQAWYSTEIKDILEEKGVTQSDVMSTARRYEKKGDVYVRGYRSDERQTPFKRGYLLTWIDQDKPREQALREAVDRTDKALMDKSSTNPTIERVHIVRDEIVTATELRELVSFSFLNNKMKCSKRKAEYAVERALELFHKLREIKIFNNYKYYYHESMSPEDLRALVEMKENYLRKAKGRDARVGHNWEACVGWFVDKFTVGAKFETQNHRDRKMDQRRITLHLLKSVGDRRSNAEVDRVWRVTPSPFSPTITYVLECKWGLVRKRDVDDFFDVLRWSKRFGVDTKDGRELRQGVVGLFAGGTFNPKEKVHVRGKTIELSEYAGRMNIRLLRASEFNQKLRERGCDKRVTVQKTCRRSRNEKEVRKTLNRIWENPEKAEEILSELTEKNKGIFQFEEMLEDTRGSPTTVTKIPKTSEKVKN